MSIEWARARARENCRRERERAQSIQGAAAPEVEMVIPLQVTFWGESTPPVEVKSNSIGAARQAERAPREAEPSYFRTHRAT
jgi:hypothetical protein